MQWFVLEEQVSLLGLGEMGGYGWVGCIHVGQGRSAEVMEVGDNSVGSEAEVILAERQNFDCTEEKVEVCAPVGRRMAEEMAEEMGEEMVGEKNQEMVCTVGIAGSADHIPDRAGEDTRTSASGEYKPLC